MVHEFEALLLAKPLLLAQVMNALPKASQVQAIRDQFSNPEEINDDPLTALSKRVQSLFPEYRKRLHGPLTTTRIGLAVLRTECPHFNEWMTCLEGLA
jgi:hypothetical protein